MRGWIVFSWIGPALALAVGCSEEPTSRVGRSTPDAASAEDVGGLSDAEIRSDAGSMSEADVGGPGLPDGVEILDLGMVALGGDGRSGPLEFTLPVGVASFMVRVEGPLEAGFIVRTLVGPTSVLVSDDDSGLTPLERVLFGAYGAQFISPNRVVQDRGAMAAQFPNNPGVTVIGERTRWSSRECYSMEPTAGHTLVRLR